MAVRLRGRAGCLAPGGPRYESPPEEEIFSDALDLPLPLCPRPCPVRIIALRSAIMWPLCGLYNGPTDFFSITCRYNSQWKLLCPLVTTQPTCDLKRRLWLELDGIASESHWGDSRTRRKSSSVRTRTVMETSLSRPVNK